MEKTKEMVAYIRKRCATLPDDPRKCKRVSANIQNQQISESISKKERGKTVNEKAIEDTKHKVRKQNETKIEGAVQEYLDVHFI